MKSKWKLLLMTFFLSIGLLAGCNMDDNSDNGNNNNNENEVDEQENTDTPPKYDDETNTNEIDEDHIRDKDPGSHEENPEETDMELDKGSDREFDKDKGAE